MNISEREMIWIKSLWNPPRKAYEADHKLRRGESISLKEAREASLRSMSYMANKLGMVKGSYQSLELNEEIGNVTLASLRRAAHVLDCELIYTLKPRNNRQFRNAILEQCLAYAETFPQVQQLTDERRRGTFIAARANEAILNPKFKHFNSWTRESIPTVKADMRI